MTAFPTSPSSPSAPEARRAERPALNMQHSLTPLPPGQTPEDLSALDDVLPPLSPTINSRKRP